MSNPSSAHIGTDTHGQPVRIGQLDSDGERVGWIDPATGQAYTSYAERWESEAIGRYTDAYNDWRHAGRPEHGEPSAAFYAFLYSDRSSPASPLAHDELLPKLLDTRMFMRMAVAERGR